MHSTFVCVPCRTALRAVPAFAQPVRRRCPTCGSTVRELPWSYRLPSREDGRGWQAVEQAADRLEIDVLTPRRAEAAAKARELLAEIDWHSSQTASESRRRWLQAERLRILREHATEVDQPPHPQK